MVQLYFIYISSISIPIIRSHSGCGALCLVSTFHHPFIVLEQHPQPGSNMVLGPGDLVASALWQICSWKEVQESCWVKQCCWWLQSGVHQLRLVVYPFIPLFTRFMHSRWCRISFINSMTSSQKIATNIEASMGILQRKIILKPLETIGNQQIISELNHLCDSNPVRSPQECNLQFAAISASTL